MSTRRPSKKEKVRLLAQTLEFANVVRKALGHKALKRLKKGVIGQDDHCPLFHTFNGGCLSVAGDEAEFETVELAERVVAALRGAGYQAEMEETGWGEKRSRVLFYGPRSNTRSIPERFVEDFDAGYIPELTLAATLDG